MSGSSSGSGRLPSILHINTEKTWRGGESQVSYLMNGLRAAGHRICVAALPGSALAARSRDAGIDVFEMKMAGDLDIGAASRLARFARAGRFDILHAHTARAHAIGLLARLLGAPQKLVVARRLDFPVSTNLFGRLKYRSRRIDLFLAVAAAIREILVAAGVPSERVRVVNSSIDLARFEEARQRRKSDIRAVREELGLPADATLVGNVAALAGHKAQCDLIAAMPDLLERTPTAHLVIVGEGKERASLTSQVHRLGLTERVHFLGFRRDVPLLLAAFDIFAISSKLEGFCNSVLEAFAVGVPVVATRAGGLPEMVLHEDTGLLTPVQAPPALAEAMTRLIDNPALAAKVAASGRHLVESEYTVDKMVERTRAAYAELSEEASAAA
jgi:glycosyltransferase involved in cell wall biosynthesis